MDDEPGQRIEVFLESRCSSANRKEIERVAAAVLKRQGCRQYRLSIAVVDDAQMARLNRRHLGRAGATDVLAFDLSDGRSCGGEIDGEVVVSAETARREARRRGGDVRAELMLYVVHGILHLSGQDDSTPRRAAAMHRREDGLLAELGYGRPFAAGARGDRSARGRQRHSGSGRADRLGRAGQVKGPEQR
ncbi:MAG: rRNA maturation RNase YbeY [Phycisphaerae bacterium]